MSISLDHIIVPSSNRNASAKQLAELLDVPWEPARVGPFTAVYVNDGLTLDFDERSDSIPLNHYCFRVSEEEFDAIFGRIRAAGIDYRSTPIGAVDMQIGHHLGGRLVYWDKPDGHVWEILTVSYARQS